MKKLLFVMLSCTAICAQDSLVKDIIGNNGPISWIADEGSHFGGVIKRDIYELGSDCSQGWQNSCQFLKRWSPSIIRTVANILQLSGGAVLVKSSQLNRNGWRAQNGLAIPGFFFLWRGARGLLHQCGVEQKGFVRELQGGIKDFVTLD